MYTKINKNIFGAIDSYNEGVQKQISSSGSAFVIMKDNEIIHEWYSGTHHFEEGARKIDGASQFNVYSTRVTYVGLALALAVFEGYLNLDDRLCDFFNDLDSETLGETTIRHLLTRCTGLKINGGKVSRIFNIGTNIEGKRPDLLAKIHEISTGKTISQVLKERVFQPLNWSQTGWMTEGKSTLVCDIHSHIDYPTIRLGSRSGEDRNLYVSARELAYWGNLHLNKGLVNNKQVLAKEIFELSTTIQSPSNLPKKHPKFGFLWWIKDSETSCSYNEMSSELPEGSFQILGASNCSCTVLPKYTTVAVRMYNSLCETPKEHYSYLEDINTYGNLVVSAIKELH
ncbi:serine hydrolase domain-containing protein [Cytobacillus sp. IB215316]|uniref:serine hydrolase domain-containing protein n=1 Tax=Cytobacillus sp. IB215316 TaxID=3097354 RepID=UPI002A1591E7|nr:serine hydrolase domain-containing protein [Cytobacillus sp. IB215316]MDX8363427.1 serine hydrolase domain-containing protein [Cytobacillus sp. IB215316]